MIKRMLKSYDYSLIFAVFLLCGFGLVMVYSSSVITAVTKYKQHSDYFFNKQTKALIVGSLIFLFTAFFPYKAFANRKFQKLLLLGSLCALIALFGVGYVAGNAQSWYKISNYSIQPGEFVKLTVILYLSSVYAKKQSYINNLGTGIAPPALLTVVICVLVAVQPDFGTAFIIGLIALCIILCSGFSGKTLLKLLTLAGVVFVLVSPLILFNADDILTKERLSRFESYQNPFEDQTGKGFQVSNSLIAIGTGGIFGLGLGESIQKYNYLPEAHTDFIMAVIAEELGVFGVLFVILLLSFIVIKGFYIARKCEDPFGSLLAIGISSMIALQTFINLGGISGLIPLTGVTLPFISYGGSSLVVLLASMGILVNISMFNEYFNRSKRKQPINTTKFKENQYQKSINY
ncbi:putative lipid II flippase FtsW [Bacillus sp. CLL-7-23]|uniref:Probable peptidoglycan glycosyltransferase FtsW n=1 Tax=Bacillus changyiensis TaxID=3004103 RepID=A0ABT4X202_9BACI|nr:putative lipid II flippase FtsW [Bacillus changyiensis]MDA7026329.1 putative lipid II flippase FtsW [Bacillus changyiensis]